MEKSLRYDVFISGKFVDLFVLTEEHALHTDWYNWFNDAETMQYMEHHRFPNTPAKQLEYFKTALENSPKRLQFGIMDKNKVFIGIVSLSNIDYISQKAEVAIVIGDKKYQKVHYSVEAMSLLIEHAFFSLNLHRVHAASASKWICDFWIRMLKFTYEGMFRQYLYKDGVFHDCYICSILRDEFRPFKFEKENL